MSDQVAKIISLAKAEVGYHEGRSSDGHWNNKEKYAGEVPGLAWADYQAWCATFVSWLAYKADVADLYPRTASCAYGVSWFKKKDRWSEYPAVGAQVFFGVGTGGVHTGIVYKYDAEFIYTIEGNTNDNGSAEGDGVYDKRRFRRINFVHGYGYPEFTDGIVTADPTKKGKPGFTYASSAEAPKLPAPKPKPAPKPSVSVKALNDARAKDIPAPTGHTSHAADVKVVEDALVAEGLLEKKWADGSWGTLTQEAYDAFRRAEGYKGDDAKGAVGKESLTKLAKRHGFTVRA